VGVPIGEHRDRSIEPDNGWCRRSTKPKSTYREAVPALAAKPAATRPDGTGNPPYSIPSYSGGIGGVFGESCDSQRTGAHERGLTADLPQNLTVGRHHGLLGG
jgi:hypothetical protein